MTYSQLRAHARALKQAGASRLPLSRAEFADVVLNASISEVGSELRSRIAVEGEDALTMLSGLLIEWV